LAWIGGVGLLGLTPAMGFAQGLPLPPAPEGVTQTQTLPVAPTAAAPSPAASQDVVQTGGSDQRIARPRDLVVVGVENQRKGEYDVADVYLKKAQEYRAQLSPAEQKDLDAALQRNTSALATRKQGQEQIKRASEAFNAGRLAEANAMLKAAAGNLYLTPEDKRSIATLNDIVAKTSPVTPQVNTQHPGMPAGKSYGDMLTHGRKLLQQGNLDEARTWAITAAQSGTKPRWTAPWDDTSDKLLRDIDAAQKKMAAGGPAAQVKLLCQQAKSALKAGNVAEAKRLAHQAETIDAPWFEKQGVAEVNHLIAQAEPRSGGMTAPAGAGPVQVTDAKAAVRDANAALARGELDRAEQLALAARNMQGVSYGMFEKTPDSVLADVLKAREREHGKQAAELLAQARHQLDAGNLDEAERLASRSKVLKSSYGMFEFGDRPDKVLDECRTKRMVVNRNKSLPSLNEPASTARQRPQNPATTTHPVPPTSVVASNQGAPVPPAPTPPSLGTPPAPKAPVADAQARTVEANRLMAEARRHLTLGEYEQALAKATHVKQMGVATYDKPENIYEAVKLAQASRQNAGNPAADAKRTKALQLLAGARLKLKSGDILGARKDAVEAKSLGATLRQGDDLPEAVLAELQTKAREQVETYSKAAETLAQRGKNGEAQQYHNYVMNVAVAFNLPAMPMGTGAAVTAKAVVNTTDVAAQGAKLCGEIEGCLKDKQLAQAKKLANALAEGPYGLKVKANEYLAKIDGEETRTAIERAELHLGLFVKAMNRREYDVARSYAEKVDKRYLDAVKGKQFQELLTSPDYQQHVAGNDKVNPSIYQASGAQDGPAAKGTQSALLDEVKKKHTIEYQRLREMTNAARGKATRLSQNGDLDGAVRELKTALETVKKADSDIPKVPEMTRQLEAAVAQYQKLADQIAFDREAQDKLNAKRNASLRKSKDEENRREQISTLMAQCKKLMSDGKYAEAQRVAEKAHAIDPTDAGVDIVREMAIRERRVHDEERITRNNEEGVAGALQDMEASKYLNVGNNKPVAFDGDFAAKSRSRLDRLYKHIREQKKEEFPSNSRMGSTVSIDFRNKPLIEALDELRALSGLNIWVDVQALQYEGIDEKAPVSATLTGVSLKTALDYILRNIQLTYTIKDGIITITTRQARAVSTKVTKHYPVHDLITPRDDMAQLQNVNPDAVPVGGSANMSPFMVAKDDVGYNGPTNSGGGQMNGQWNKRRTGQTLERQLIGLITSSVEPESWKANGQGGQGTIEYFPIGMTFVITQQSDIQEQINDLLNRLRELQEVQITVEVRILTLTDDFFERMGVDFNVLIPDKQTAFDAQIASANFAPAGQLNTNDHLHGVVVGLTPNGNFTNNLDIPISNDSFRQARLPTGFAGIGPPGSTGGLDIGVAFLSSIQVFLVMEAVQGDVRNNTLQAPKVTLFNGQVASIQSSTTQLFVTSVTAVPNFFTGIPVFIPVQSPFQSGTFLTLQAVVTHDRRYVQLTLSPTILTVTDSGRNFQAVAGITLQQPVTSTITVSTTVMVPDGGTILVGGLKTMSEQRREFGPPILSKIPYINRLFRNQSYGKSASSLLFMVTPRIIINEEEEEKLGNTFSF